MWMDDLSAVLIYTFYKNENCFFFFLFCYSDGSIKGRPRSRLTLTELSRRPEGTVSVWGFYFYFFPQEQTTTKIYINVWIKNYFFLFLNLFFFNSFVPHWTESDSLLSRRNLNPNCNFPVKPRLWGVPVAPGSWFSSWSWASLRCFVEGVALEASVGCGVTSVRKHWACTERETYDNLELSAHERNLGALTAPRCPTVFPPGAQQVKNQAHGCDSTLGLNLCVQNQRRVSLSGDVRLKLGGKKKKPKSSNWSKKRWIDSKR